ncbi:MAG: asparagine synthase (glutamine-hydrolyzing) [Desulfobaccales bacterium]
MCGICGLLGNPTNVARQEMLRSLNHRGPDDQGEYEVQSSQGMLWFGHRRLSIQDPSPAGRQPMTTRDGRFVIVFNGEIYNFKEIRRELEGYGYRFKSHSDTEVILAAWDKWGLDALPRFRGMFAWALWDRKEQCLWLVRDRIGEKPLYYTQQPDRLLFSSEIRSLLASGVVERRIDADGLDSFLTFGSVSQPYTMVKDVRCLLPGHYLKYQNGVATVHPYWSLNDILPASSPYSYEDAMEEVERIMLEATNLCMVSDVPVGLLLSGGVDSTSLLAFLNKNGYSSIKTFSVVFEGRDRKFSEEYWSDKAVHHFPAVHTKIKMGLEESKGLIAKAVEGMDQPSIDGLNTFIVCQAIANQGLKVAITGQGGDELFLGYNWRKVFPGFMKLAGYSLSEPLLRLADSCLAFLPRLAPHYGHHGKNVLHLFRDGEAYAMSYLGAYSIFNWQEIDRLRGMERPSSARFVKFLGNANASPLEVMWRLQISNYLCDTLLRDGDQMSMACSLELRAPFLDARLIELVASLPIDYKIHSSRQKPLLVDATKNEFIREISARAKAGFALPLNNWLRSGLKVGDPLTLAAGLDKKEILKTIKGFQKGEKYLKFLALSMLAAWVEKEKMLFPIDRGDSIKESLQPSQGIEVDRIERVYAKREKSGVERLYSFFNPGYLFGIQGRERYILQILSKCNISDLSNKKILDIGCGSGNVLRSFQIYGAKPENIYGIDLLTNKIQEAKWLSPNMNFVCGNAEMLPYEDNFFDIIITFTVFSSILNEGMKQNISREMLRVLRPEGLILWYDYFYNNPLNPDVRGMKKKEIQRLFPDCTISFKRTTLAPLLARAIAPNSWLCCSLLEETRIFNTHYIGTIKPSRIN